MEVSRSASSPVQSTQKPTQLQKNEQSNQQAPRADTEVKSTPPKPVVNTQGQTTGRVLNVTA